MNNRSLMDRLIQCTIVNENHLHLLKQSSNITNVHFSYFLDVPQQPAHMGVRSRMVALFKFVLPLLAPIRPSTLSFSFGVLGFFWALVS